MRSGEDDAARQRWAADFEEWMRCLAGEPAALRAKAERMLAQADIAENGRTK